MKWPVSVRSLMEARLYALESNAFTFEYPGWEAKDRAAATAKLERIYLGRFGQVWFAEFCRLNGIPFKGDTTTAQQVDDCDLIVCGLKVDVKVSKVALPPQVSPGVMGKAHVYLFLQTNDAAAFIEPLGFISSGRFKRHAVRVAHGEPIPGTSYLQRFKDGSFFLTDAAQLTGFEDMAAQLISERAFPRAKAAA